MRWRESHGDFPATPVDLARQIPAPAHTAANVEHAIAFRRVFDGLLFGQRSDADHSIIGGIKSLDKTDQAFSAVLRNVRNIEILGERTILAIPILERLEPLEVAPKIIATLLRRVMSGKNVFRRARRFRGSLLRSGSRDWAAAVNKFRAQFDCFVADLVSENSATDATARFQNVNAQTSGY